MTSGWSAIGSMNGTGLDGPKRRLNATCSSGERRWPRKNTHLVVEHRAADLGDDLVVEVVGEVDTADDRAARARDRSTVTRRYAWPGAAAATGMRSDDAVVTPSHPRDAASGGAGGHLGTALRSGSRCTGTTAERPSRAGRCS